MENENPLIELKNVVKHYVSEAGAFPALKGINMRVRYGEFLGIIGKSGAGKTNLIRSMVFQDLEEGNENSDIYGEFLEGMSSEYKESTPKAEIIRDFIAGMTDRYAIVEYERIHNPRQLSFASLIP